VLGTGSEPRVTLRVARWTGLRYRMTVRATGWVGAPGAVQLPGPITSVLVESEVLRGSAEPLVEQRHGGTVRLIEERAKLMNVSVTQPGVPQPVLDFWNAALARFRNTTYLQHVAESAEVTQLNAELLGGALPPQAVAKAVDETLEQQHHVPFRLPPSPVGVGARWRFSEDLVINGAHGSQAVDMTLRTIDANQAVIGVVVHQQAPRQDIANPLAPGTKAVLESFDGIGGGEVVVDRLTAIVLSGIITVTTRSTLTTDAGGNQNTGSLVGTSSMQLAATILHDGPDGGAP
jgi:hypothetical protein